MPHGGFSGLLDKANFVDAGGTDSIIIMPRAVCLCPSLPLQERDLCCAPGGQALETGLDLKMPHAPIRNIRAKPGDLRGRHKEHNGVVMQDSVAAISRPFDIGPRWSRCAINSRHLQLCS